LGLVLFSRNSLYYKELAVDQVECGHPDLHHPESAGSHWDYHNPNGDNFRVYPSHHERK
jgi:hypothetical protein